MTDWRPGIPIEYRNQIVTGDARELAKRIPDESVDLIFTDPIYSNIDDYRWLAETAARVLKPRGHLVAYYLTSLNRQTANALFDGGMNPLWILTAYKRGGPSSRIAIGFSKTNQAHFCIKKNQKMWQHNLIDVIESVTVSTQNGHHVWQKSTSASLRWIRDLTDSHNAIVYDPFTGGGTVPAVCKMLGRNYIASEIDTDTARLARERVQRTQPPLDGFNEAMEQAALFDG